MNLQTSGIIFDVKEFAINDGPGIRVTVFLKGCPLRCLWCHNPEGIGFEPERNCKTGRTVGEQITAEELAKKLRRFSDVFELTGGGVTFSGGEPLAQPEFLFAVASQLTDIHLNLDTSGYAEQAVFRQALEYFDLVYFDLKLADENLHKKYTSVENKLILQNLQTLAESNVDFALRLPQIPTLTNTKENLEALREIIYALPRKPQEIALLAYNSLAGGKYPVYGKTFGLSDNLQTNFAVLEDLKAAMPDFPVKIYGTQVQERE